jgi:ribose/xylose/arabinose/galactoside ABC-type transport system permease subunit
MKALAKIWNLCGGSRLGPLLALLVIVGIFISADSLWGSGKFASWSNSRAMVGRAAQIAVPALGMTLIIIAGGIDLSAGTALTLSGTVLATMLKNQSATSADPSFTWAIAMAVLAALATGIFCGLVNGSLISSTEVVPFIVTLGTMTIFLGIGQIIAKESTVYAPKDHTPGWLQDLCYTGANSDKYRLIAYVPTNAIVAIILTLLVTGLLNYTVFGRNIFALGSNPLTARLCGISIGWTIVCVYTLAGLFFALGGLLYFGEVKNGNPPDGTGKELEIIAAVVLGGGSLAGGRGWAFGTVLGSLIIVVIRNGCTMLSIPNTYTHIIIGIIIIVAVIVDQLRSGLPEWLFRRLSSS